MDEAGVRTGILVIATTDFNSIYQTPCPNLAHMFERTVLLQFTGVSGVVCRVQLYTDYEVLGYYAGCADRFDNLSEEAERIAVSRVLIRPAIGLPNMSEPNITSVVDTIIPSAI